MHVRESWLLKGNPIKQKFFIGTEQLNTQLYQRKSSGHTTSWIKVLISENLKGKEMFWIHKRNSSMKYTKPIMICWNHLMTRTHLITGSTHVIVNTSSVEWEHVRKSMLWKGNLTKSHHLSYLLALKPLPPRAPIHPGYPFLLLTQGKLGQ